MAALLRSILSVFLEAVIRLISSTLSGARLTYWLTRRSRRLIETLQNLPTTRFHFLASWASDFPQQLDFEHSRSLRQIPVNTYDLRGRSLMNHSLRAEESHRMKKYSWVIAVAVAVSSALMAVDLWMWQREHSALAMEATTPEPSILAAPAWAATVSEGPAIKRPEEQWDSELRLPSKNVSLAQ